MVIFRKINKFRICIVIADWALVSAIFIAYVTRLLDKSLMQQGLDFHAFLQHCIQRAPAYLFVLNSCYAADLIRMAVVISS
jgi:hypothetical protein